MSLFKFAVSEEELIDGMQTAQAEMYASVDHIKKAKAMGYLATAIKNLIIAGREKEADILTNIIKKSTGVEVYAKKKDELPKNPGKTEGEKKVWQMYGYAADDVEVDEQPIVHGDPDKEYKVVLIRGNGLPEIIWYKGKEKKAKNIAQTLADLHGTQVDVSDDDKLYTVDGTEYYKPKEPMRFEEEKPGIELREELESFEDE